MKKNLTWRKQRSPDYDNDSWQDLLLVGEYMPVTFFRNEQGKKLVKGNVKGLEESEGWWKTVTAGDFDNDGDMDYLAGNFGLNSHYRASAAEPINVAYKDFDNNGALEAITSYYEDGINYPTTSLDILASQLPMIKQKILYHRTYANTTTGDLLAIAGKEGIKKLYCRTLQSSYIENQGNGSFGIRALPLSMQTSPVYGIITDDVNEDGYLDFFAVGNSYAPDVVSGRCDAFIGETMLGDGRGNFRRLPVTQSGFFVHGDAKSIVNLLSARGRLLVISQNNDSLKAFARNRKPDPFIRLTSSEAVVMLTLQNGDSRRVEIGYGTGYISQSSRTLFLTPQTSRADIYDTKGRKMRSASLKGGKIFWEPPH